jgi:hypothetical protein
MDEVNPYEFIRKVWNSKEEVYESALDHADDLNHIVGTIKMGVKRLINAERDNTS